MSKESLTNQEGVNRERLPHFSLLEKVLWRIPQYRAYKLRRSEQELKKLAEKLLERITIDRGFNYPQQPPKDDNRTFHVE